ncbi:UDP-glucose 4-epimerase GalE [Billgrantia desiderata]|uniref:UDP-glucose 4-epimerase GalE n=1 Tax=Billgrantia desiderata TaxID=52021 RepID=UPI00089E4E20|nr:UDP-glucose 4-epimerase GalE [Halomonas desiderata]SEG06156.1 UDP-glucose 4-epimerase [Halomonas desiderata]
MTILVTGGAGYIGSHTVLTLLEAGYGVVVLDNLCNASLESLRRVERMAGRELAFVKGDVCDQACLDAIFAEWEITAVIHLAGLKAVEESVQQPLDYYGNNVGGSLTLYQAMRSAGVHRLVFSSSATVYGAEAPVPYREDFPRGVPSSAYGASKAMVEQMLEELCSVENAWSVVMLRYFNPIGAHASGQIGEDPRGFPNNLMPYIAQVAAGRRETLSIFGDDYPTVDGTCERDYLHVMDLAEGHVVAMKHLDRTGIQCYNLGTGRPVSVLQMVSRFIAVNGVDVPYLMAPRRAGDLPAFWADPTKAWNELGWRARRCLDSMVRDTWRWQQLNPDGYP